MQQNLHPHLNVIEFQNYLAPFIDKADKGPNKQLRVVDDGYDSPTILYLKVALVLTLPWVKHGIHTRFTNNDKYRHSLRWSLLVSNNGNLYLCREEQQINFKIKGVFKNKLKIIDRDKSFYVYTANVKNFRTFVLDLRYHNMLTEELKKALVRDG